MTTVAALIVAVLTVGTPADPPARIDRPDPAVRAHRTAAEPVRAAGTAVVGGIWANLADCESDGRWDYNGPSGFDGGLQFHPSTWDAHRDPTDPPYAYLATPNRQIAIAERVLAAQGWGAWPACSAALGLR